MFGITILAVGRAVLPWRRCFPEDAACIAYSAISLSVFQHDEVMEERRKIQEPGCHRTHVDRRIADSGEE